MKSEFKVGQTVVHPTYGIGIISGIEEREFRYGKATQFYIVSIEDNGTHRKVFIPFDSNKRLRKVINRMDVAAVFAYLREPRAFIEVSTWNRRYREYMEKIHTGITTEIAEVFKALYVIGKSRELSFGERKMLDQTRGLLVKELSIATGATEENIELKIEKYLEVAHESQ
jgi:CarD family transcriptional regulator